MPWVTAIKIEQESRIREIDNGFDFNPAFRSRFIYFKFTGLRPNDSHWLFLQGRDVTSFANTSFSINDFNASARSSVFRNPGDKYLLENQFPSDLGGPTGSPLTTTAAGELEGVLFIQSNSTYSWRVGSGTTNYSYNGGDNSIPLLAINISTTNKSNALSHATAEYASIGQFINYAMEEYTVDVEVEYEEWEDDPPPAPGPVVTSGNDNNDNDNWGHTNGTIHGGGGMSFHDAHVARIEHERKTDESYAGGGQSFSEIVSGWFS